MKQYTFYIDTGSGYVQFHPFYEKATIERSVEEGVIYSKDKIEGELIFKGDEYDTLFALLSGYNNRPIQIKYDGVTKITGYIDLLGVYNEDRKYCKLKVYNETPFDKIENKINDDIDIMDGQTERRSLFFWGETTNYIFNCFKLNDIIQKIINEIDDTVKFNSDSFSVFATLDVDWSNIHFATAKNTSEWSTHSFESETEISLKTIFDMLASLFHIYWTLDLIGGDYYFRLYHFTQINKSLGSGAQYDLTTYKGRDWTSSIEYEYDNSKRYRLIKRNITVSKYNDFIGRDIVIPAFDKIKETLEIGVDNWLFDVEGLTIFPDEYPSNSSNFFLLAADNTYVKEADSEFNTWSVHWQPVGSNVQLTWETGTPRLKVEVLTATTEFIIKCPYSLYKGMLHYVNVMPEFTSGELRKISLYMPESYSFENSVNEYWSSWQQSEGGTGYINTIPIVLSSYPQNLEVGFLNKDNDYVYILIECDPYITFYLDYFSIEVFRLQLLKSTGILTPSDNLLNMPLSLSNIDDKAGKCELPATPAYVNDQLVTVGVRKDRVVKDISVPIFDQTLLDFNYLEKTSIGNIELKSLSISLKQDFAKISGKL